MGGCCATFPCDCLHAREFAGGYVAPSPAVLYSPSQDVHFFACKLQHIVSIDALGVRADLYLEDLAHRSVDLVTCLAGGQDARVTYDLRTIAMPDADGGRGKVTVALLCRAEMEKKEAAGLAINCLHLFKATFEEYDFELVEPSEIRQLLRPFNVRSIVSVGRRCSLEALDTLRGGTRVDHMTGLTQAEPAAPVDDGAEKIFHVSPFLPAPPTADLLKLILLHDSPVMISCRIRPAKLEESEERFLEKQIAKCEVYAQATIGPIAEDLSKLAPTLREQAHTYQQYQYRMLFGLQDKALLMTVALASSKALPESLADALGASITEPAGSSGTRGERNTFAFFAGGYDVTRLNGEGADAFEKLEMVLPPHSIAHKDAQRLPYLFDCVEAAASFHFPPATVRPECGIAIKNWRELSPVHDLPTTGLLIGYSEQNGKMREVRLGLEDRQRHIYAVGQTGTGKTTLLKTLILDDINSGRGVCVMDPHGDLYRELLGRIPEERMGDVVLLDPTDTEYPIGLNPLEYETEGQRHFLVQEMVAIMSRMLEDEYGVGSLSEFAGPIFFQHMRMNLLLVMSRQKDPGTLLEFHRLFQEREFWQRWLPLAIDDPQLEHWVKEVLPKANYLRATSTGEISMGEYVASKFENFVFDPALRNIFGQKRSSINLRQVMDEGKILLVNLAKGELTEPNSRFLGMLLLAKLQATAMARVKIPPEQRRPFYLYVDEFQSLATQNFVTMLSEARKFGVSLVLANQFVSQIHDHRIVEAIFGNVGTFVAFRLGQADAEIVEKEMAPVIGRNDLVNLPNWRAYMSTLAEGQAVRPFTIRTKVPEGEPNRERAEMVTTASREKYSRGRSKVEKEIAGMLGIESHGAEPAGEGHELVKTEG